MIRDSHPRVVVLQPEGFPAEDPPAVPVGALRWRGALERLVLVVKATFTAAPGQDTLVWAPAQLPLSRGERHRLSGALPEELAVPNDFVPRKAEVDVILSGHAHAARPAPQIEAMIRIGALTRAFAARASAPTTAIPLTAAYLSPFEPCSARLAGVPDDGARDDDRADFSHHGAAPRAQRTAHVADDAAIELTGLSPGGGTRTWHLSGYHPVVTAADDWLGERAVDMRLDTVWIDTDRMLAALVWRGEIGLHEGPHDLSRLVVAMEKRGHERSLTDRLPAFQRGHAGLTVRPEDAAGEIPPPTEDEAFRLEIARRATWLSPAPEPRLPLDAYAALSVELSEAREPRAALLERRGLDEDRFLIEERAWLEAIARRAMTGDVSLAEQHASALARAEAAITRPGDEGTLESFLRIRHDLAVADDPTAALAAHRISLGRYLRVERHWLAAAETDPTVQEALSRADAEPEPEPDAEGAPAAEAKK
jgi:hypothetical protein